MEIFIRGTFCFGKARNLLVLDRSRGEWGEPADDVTSLTMNYLFFSLQRSGRLDGNLEVIVPAILGSVSREVRTI